MAEIKSSIELAMEKTKGLVLSQEEREKLKEEEFHSKAHALVNRFLKVDLHLREVEKELAKYDPDQRDKLEKLMVEVLTEAIQLDQDNDFIFEGIQTLQGQKKNIIGKIRELTASYRKRKEKEYQKIEKDLQMKLERQGISGSAVQPKVEGSQEWLDALAKLKPDFETRLHALKEELLK